MAQLITNYTNFVPPSSTSVLKSGNGKIHAIFASSTSTTPATIVIYDNTSGSGNILFSFQAAAPQPVCFVLPNYLALKFYLGCTVVTPANVTCYLATEETETSITPPTADENSYHCKAYSSIALAIPHNSNYPVYFNSEQSDEGGMHSTVSNTSRLTIKSAGFYIVGGGFSFAANATGVRGIGLQLNGATYLAYIHTLNVGVSFEQGLAISTSHDFALNDYLELYAFQNSGAPLNLTAGWLSPYAWAAKVL